MPIRKLSRQCGYVSTELTEKLEQIGKLYDEFQDFKERWRTESSAFVHVHENELLENVETMKVQAELAMLKDYIGM